MPYKDLERKRQWERQHREQRNARRREQRLDARSGQPTVSNTTSDIPVALGTLRRPSPDPVSGQEPKDTWKSILGWVLGIGVVLFGAFVSVSSPLSVDGGASPGSGNSGPS